MKLAAYKYPQYVVKLDNPMFDGIHAPGIAAPYAGIFRCDGCGHEIGIAQGHTLPPQHEKHTAGTIRWRLAVWAVHKT